MTKLGLVEITRKKGRKSLYEQIKEIETKQSERQGE
jgi:Ribonuclease G/E